MSIEINVESIDKVEYSNSSKTQFLVYLRLLPDNILFEIVFENVQNEKDVKNIIKNFNNPYRLSDLYKYSEIKPFNEKVYSCDIESPIKFKIKSGDKKGLEKFLYLLNTPTKLDEMDLFEEHQQLSTIIDTHIQTIHDLIKRRREIEYKLWEYGKQSTK